jgi:structural maintenance of chromosomes protein 6
MLFASRSRIQREKRRSVFELVCAGTAADSYAQGMAEYGVIEGIEVTDFMCHNHLRFEFGPQINFIIGEFVVILSKWNGATE